MGPRGYSLYYVPLLVARTTLITHQSAAAWMLNLSRACANLAHVALNVSQVLDSRHDSELLELRAYVRNTAHHKARRWWAACNSAAPRHSQILPSPAQARVVTVEAPSNKIALQRAPKKSTTSESMIALTRACTVKLIRVLFPQPMSNTSHAVQNLCCSPPIGQNCYTYFTHRFIVSLHCRRTDCLVVLLVPIHARGILHGLSPRACHTLFLRSS